MSKVEQSLDLNTDKTSKPFLRWAGGKTWLVKYLHTLLPSHFNNYHEPFLGGGAIFLSIKPKGISYLSDLNNDLIQTYDTLKTNVDDVISYLKQYENSEEFYYRIRDTEYTCKVQNAAKFIYLNQTSFNGIYRVNLKGKYNVPYGYRSKNFLEEDNLRLVSKSLKNANLFHSDFDILKSNVKEKDLVFIDPPYTVSHNQNGFIKYNQKLFSLDDQYRLSTMVDTIKSRGAYYILTNAAHSTILEIFDKKDKMLELSRANLIGGNNAKRGQTTEYIFTNVN